MHVRNCNARAAAVEEGQGHFAISPSRQGHIHIGVISMKS
jgi:hypothetical protein